MVQSTFLSRALWSYRESEEYVDVTLVCLMSLYRLTLLCFLLNTIDLYLKGSKVLNKPTKQKAIVSSTQTRILFVKTNRGGYSQLQPYQGPSEKGPRFQTSLNTGLEIISDHPGHPGNEVAGGLLWLFIEKFSLPSSRRQALKRNHFGDDGVSSGRSMALSNQSFLRRNINLLDLC